LAGLPSQRRHQTALRCVDSWQAHTRTGSYACLVKASKLGLPGS
jgi:hypothetical protein